MYEGLQGAALNTLCSAVSAARWASLSTATGVQCACCYVGGRSGETTTSAAEVRGSSWAAAQCSNVLRPS